jgi:IMP dehydrogenase/GMP reductase
MKSLYDKCKKAKALSKKFGYKLFIMTGNIANADTYRWICENIPEIDYIRVGIGGGSGCITTSNTAIHYPQASLIEECYCVKKLLSAESKLDFPKIVADGGIRNYDHVIKALALGADYVMIGSVLSMCVESAGEKSTDIDSYYKLEMDEYENWWGYTRDSDEKKFIGYLDVKFFGMASADGQRAISGEKTKTSEGITKWLPVKFTLKGWTENMASYLRSAMSYAGCYDLEAFIGETMLIVNSPAEIQSVNK